MNASAFPRLRSALWTIVLLAVATTTAGGIGLHQWLAQGDMTPRSDLPAEPAAIVPGGQGASIDHAVVASLPPEPEQDTPALSVAAYER